MRALFVVSCVLSKQPGENTPIQPGILNEYEET